MQRAEWTGTPGDWIRLAGVLLAFAAVVYASYKLGTPRDAKGEIKLPAAAFSWPFLFHVERSAAVLGAVGLVLLVGWRASYGDFPIKFGNVEYAAREADRKAEAATQAQELRLQYVEGILGIAPPPEEDAATR